MTVPGTAQQHRATIDGTWRADANNYWTRANSERWISLQLQYDDSNTGIGVGTKLCDPAAVSTEPQACPAIVCS